MRRVVIKRDKWGQKALYTVDAKYCCLGFCAKAAGVTDAAMFKLGMPDGLGTADRAAFEQRFPKLTEDLMDELAETNDNGDLTRNQKEKKIKKLGRAADIDFRFVDR